MYTRRIAAAIALVVLGACQPAAPALTDADRTAIADSTKTMMQGLFATLNARDVERMFSYYKAGEFISAENGTMAPNRAAIDSGMRAFWGGLREANLAEDSNKVVVLDRDNVVYAAFWHGAFTDTTGNSMSMSGLWTGVVHRGDEGWKVVAEHNSMPPGSMPAPPPPPRRRS